MGSPRRRTIEVETEAEDFFADTADGDSDDESAPPPRVAVRRARAAVATAPVVQEAETARTKANERTEETPTKVRRGPPAPILYEPKPNYARGRELGALLFFVAAVFLALALASYDERGGADWVGPVGARLSQICVAAIGVAAWAIPVELALFAVPFLRSRPSVITPARLAGDVVLGATAAALLHVGSAGRVVFGGPPAGGAIGELFGEVLRSLFSTVGTFLVGVTAIALVLIARATWSFIDFANRASATTAKAASKAAAGAKGVAEAWNQARELERAGGIEPVIVGERSLHPTGELPLDPTSERLSVVPETAPEDRSGVRARPGGPELRMREDGRLPPEAHAIARQLAGAAPADRPSDPHVLPAIVLGGEMQRAGLGAADDGASVLPSATPEPAPAKAKRSRGKKDAGGPTIAPPSPEAAVQRVEGETRGATAEVDAKAKAKANAKAKADADADADAEEEEEEEGEAEEDEIEEEEEEEQEEGDEAGCDSDAEDGVAGILAASPTPTPVVEKKRTIVQSLGVRGPGVRKPGAPKKVFVVPSVDLLELAPPDLPQIDREALLRDARALVETLATYKVQGEVKEIHPGPVVTTFELEPRIGTKVREVEGLANDLRLSLAKESVRIIAPIPGKNRIGFELPNQQRIPVNFRELIEDRRFHEAKGALPVVLGRDIVGAPIYEDLAAMPHLLVAGATGAGKSVGLNVMLTSLLYRRTPEDLRMIMIDPKVVELAPFDRIPHMLLPVVTDMKQALNALKWCVDEMERRYQLLAQAGVKNITSYNAWRDKVLAGLLPNPCPKTVTTIDHNGLPEEIVDKDGSLGGEQQYPEKLPYLVVVVDEFADLMMSVGKGEVEPPIARLAQKARAAGIHVILATQRPSVDVITGMIKANFPTRIAFRVAQRVDSRTILDAQGAEYLLGKGDMLASINGKQGLKRIQCPFVSEDEVQRVCDFMRSQGEPVFDESILAPRDEDGGGDEVEDALSPKDQEVYDRCVEMVREARKCSTSWLQRKMGLGYNKAARFVDRMERTGVVGPPVGAGKDREVLI
ncbi:MAG: DNA translocase FtsK 4TM domain-containing protein [Deltaproteobacteria bacterium]|nr:DNA translocase FtsK 4TM domain-containing protein [Deltaproteobacteria bacterium]